MATKIERLKSYKPGEIVVLDTETTGLEPFGNDEILTLSITDGDGNELLDEMYKPEHRKRWPKAESINGISPAMVADKQPISASKERIEHILKSAKLIVGYNLEFDLNFLEAAGIVIPKRATFDVMKEFARVHGEYDSYHDDWRWFKLVDVADYYDYDFKAHSSNEDTKATAYCFRELLDDPWFDVPRRKPRTKVDEFGDSYVDYGDDEERVYYVSSHHCDTAEDAEMPEKPTTTAIGDVKTSDTHENPQSISGAPRKALSVLVAVIAVIAVMLVFAGAIVPAVFLAAIAAVLISALRK